MATKAEKKHFEKVLSFGCIACVKLGHGETPAEIYETSSGEVIALCDYHYRSGGIGEAIAINRGAFEVNIGTEKELINETNKWLEL